MCGQQAKIRCLNTDCSSGSSLMSKWMGSLKSQPGMMQSRPVRFQLMSAIIVNIPTARFWYYVAASDKKPLEQKQSDKKAEMSKEKYIK